MKTTFLYFPGMFENPASAKIVFKKNQKYYVKKVKCASTTQLLCLMFIELFIVIT